MKSLEEVIHNKFLVRKGVDRSYTGVELVEQRLYGKPIYTIDNMKLDDIIEIMELTTPLLCYLISTLKQERENREMHLIIKLEFPISEVSL